MPNVYALAASPVGQAVINLAQEEEKTKGARAAFGVLLMFGILCGGVWLLLQSSFGPKQAYLISGTAFWGSWLVLSVLWFTGVPGISWLGIPQSTPRFYGPQGSLPRWEVIDSDSERQEHPVPSDDALIEASPDITNQSFLAEKAAAETAASEVAPELYAEDLDVPAEDITSPGVIVVSKTEIARQGGRPSFARVTFGAAEPNATDSEDTKQLISRIEPTTVDLYYVQGTLANQTYYAMGLFTLLFLGHMLLLARYEVRNADSPKVAARAG